jgi:hypothetical protein
MQIKLRRASLAGPSDRSSAATRLIANIFQGTDLVRRHCDSPLERPTSRPGDSARLPSPTRFGPHPRSSRHSIHIGHALGSGFVQSIFSPASRRRPFECFPSASRRDADLKILCIMSSRIKCGVSGANVVRERTAGDFTPHYPKTLLLSGDRLVGEEDAR